MTAVAAQPAPPASLPLVQGTPDMKRMLAWIVTRQDTGGLPFLIIDKVNATVFALDAQGRLVGAAPALLGLARGDDSPAGIGQRPVGSITPHERITPAGRFVAGLGKELDGKDILWVDYAAGIALHPVITTKPAERRLERLASPSAADNRISYGCINVPPHFFEGVVVPLFQTGRGVVYILPETRSIDAQFFQRTPGRDNPG